MILYLLFCLTKWWLREKKKEKKRNKIVEIKSRQVKTNVKERYQNVPFNESFYMIFHDGLLIISLFWRCCRRARTDLDSIRWSSMAIFWKKMLGVKRKQSIKRKIKTEFHVGPFRLMLFSTLLIKVDLCEYSPADEQYVRKLSDWVHNKKRRKNTMLVIQIRSLCLVEMSVTIGCSTTSCQVFMHTRTYGVLHILLNVIWLIDM